MPGVQGVKVTRHRTACRVWSCGDLEQLSNQRANIFRGCKCYPQLMSLSSEHNSSHLETQFKIVLGFRNNYFLNYGLAI